MKKRVVGIIVGFLLMATPTCGWSGDIVIGGPLYCLTDDGVTCTVARREVLSASTTTRAYLNIPHGSAPNTPTNGDLWTTTGGLYVRINGATIGPVIGSGNETDPVVRGITGIVKSNGSTISAASAGTDYAAATSGSAILKGNGSGGFSAASAGTDYAAATSGSAILKGNGAGGFSAAAAGVDYAPNLSQINHLGNSKFSVWSNGTTENVGSTLVSNGGFDSDTTGWAATNSTIASVAGGQAGNCLEVTQNGAGGPTVTQTITGLTIGKRYKIVAYVKSGTSGNEAFLIQFGPVTGATGTTSGSWVAYSQVMKATNTSHGVTLEKNSTTAGTMLFDTVTVYEVTPGCVGADALAMDGWGKTTTTSVYREYNGANTPNGSFYALKVVSTGSSDGVYWPSATIQTLPEFYKNFAGRTVTFGSWVKADTASVARLHIYDGVTHTYSSYHTGGGAYEWLEITAAISASATTFYVKIRDETSGKTIYASQPTLVYGTVIGSGNYRGIPGEWIYFETAKGIAALDGVTGLSTVAGVALDLELETAGAVPKGVKAILVGGGANDSGSATADCALKLNGLANIYEFRVAPYGLTNDAIAKAGPSILPTTASGGITYDITATGSATLDVQYLRVYGVQLY